MVRQAQSYLAGAVSATALVGAAVVAFVLLVSLQALRDWPLAGITGGGDEPAVSNARSAAADGAASVLGSRAGAASDTPGAGANRPAGKSDADTRQQVDGTAGASPVPAAESPTGEAPTSSPAGGGGSDGSAQLSPSSSSSAGNGAGAQSGSSGTGGSSGQSTSGTVTGAVNDTVSGVDGALGGALGNAGVPEVTEKVVDGVAGPESVVGQTVDNVTKTVGGLLGGNR